MHRLFPIEAYRGTSTYCIIYNHELNLLIVDYCLYESKWFQEEDEGFQYLVFKLC